MANHAVGIDISDRSVEVVLLLSKKGKTILAGAARAEIPAGTIQRGVVEDVPRLSAVLTGVLDDLLGEKRRRTVAAVSIPEIAVYAKLFSMPANLGDDLVRKALAIEAAELFPVPLDDVTSDAISVSRDKEHQDIMYAVVQNEVVDKYLEALNAAGVQTTFIDTESMALARTLLPRKEAEPVLIVDIGTKMTTFVISELGGVRSSASIPFGGEHLDEALENQLKISMAEAEQLKRKAGFDLEIEDGRVVLILQRPMRFLLDEIRRTTAYYRKVTGRSISRIVLAGGVSLVPNIAEYVATNIPDHPVEKAEPLKGIALGEGVGGKTFKNDATLYATAIGLGLRALGVRAGPGMDLLPRTRRRPGAAGAFASLFSGLGSLTSLIGRMAPRKAPQSKKATRSSKKKKEELSAASMPVTKAEESAPAEEPKKADAPKAVEAAPSMKEKPPAPEPTKEEPAKPTLPPQEEKKPEPPPAPPKKVAAEPAPAPSKKAKASVSAAEDDDDMFSEGGEHEFGRGVGDLLGSVNSVEQRAGDVQASAPPKDDATSLPAIGSGKISIESILKKKVDGEGDLDEEFPDEDVEEEEAPEEMSDDADDGGDDMDDADVDAPEEPRRRGPVPALLAVLIILVLVAVTGVLMFFRKNGLPETGFLSDLFGPKAPQTEQQPPADTAPEIPSSVAVSFMAAIDQADSAGKPLVLTRVVETDVTMTDTFPATGEAPAADARATGTITVVNETSTPYTFVATTRFLTESGILFRMRETTAIPANGEVDVEVYADQEGPSGDIGPSTFTIPGLSQGLQSSVYGRSDAAMSGGSGTVKAVSEEDIALAKAALMERLQSEGEMNFKAMVREGERILPDLITSSALSFTSDPAGSEGSTFEATLELRFRALLIPETEVLPLLSDALLAALPEDVNPADYSLGSVLYTVEAYDTTTEKASVRAEAAVR